MKNFMTSGSLTQGMELEEDSDGSDTTPFPREDMIMMVYDGRPPLGRCLMSNLCPGTPTSCSWGHGDTGMYRHKFSNNIYIYVCVCVCVCMCVCVCVCEYVYYSCPKRKKEQRKAMIGRIA
jgi:hypothetical protein